MLSEKMKWSICDKMRSRSGGRNHVTASCICVACADTRWLDRRGGTGWTILATNVWFLQRCPRSMTLFRLSPCRGHRSLLYYSFTCQFILFRYGTSHAFWGDDIIQAVEGIVLPLVCFFAMRKNQSSPKIQIFASSRFYWLLPKKRERFIKKGNPDIFFFF